MFLPCFDVLCALSEYRPTAKWNLFVLYNNQDFWPYFVSDPHVDWAESKTFKQSCDPLNYRIIRKNCTNDNFKTNLYSRRNFGPQNITECQPLHWLWYVIDYSPLPDFYRRVWINISFLVTSQQSSSFFNLVEVTVIGLCPIFHRTVFLSCEICLCLSATRKNSLQNFVDQSL